MAKCASCEAPGAPLICSKCRLECYCDAGCQKAHWKTHKPDCIPQTVQGITIPCDGDLKTPGRSMFEPVDVPRSHPIHHKGHMTPLPKTVGIPLLVYKNPRPANERYDSYSLVNQKTTYLMIDTITGFAPVFEWQDDIGTVTVIRADHKPLTKLEIETIWAYHCHIIELFGDGPDHAHPEMTKERFLVFCERYKDKAIKELGRTEFEALQLPIGR